MDAAGLHVDQSDPLATGAAADQNHHIARGKIGWLPQRCAEPGAVAPGIRVAWPAATSKDWRSCIGFQLDDAGHFSVLGLIEYDEISPTLWLDVTMNNACRWTGLTG